MIVTFPNITAEFLHDTFRERFIVLPAPKQTINIILPLKFLYVNPESLFTSATFRVNLLVVSWRCWNELGRNWRTDSQSAGGFRLYAGNLRRNAGRYTKVLRGH